MGLIPNSGVSTCLIIQGHTEQINKATLMYGEVDNACVYPKGGYTDTHLHRVRHWVLSQFPDLTLDVSGMLLSGALWFTAAGSFVSSVFT